MGYPPQQAVVNGTLALTVVEARNLKSDDRDGADAFVIVRPQWDPKSENYKTHAIENNDHPNWTTKMQLHSARTDQVITFEIYDKDSFTGDDCIGTAAITLGPVADAQPHDVWLSLEHTMNSAQSHLHIWMQFYPAPGQPGPGQLPHQMNGQRPQFQVPAPEPMDRGFMDGDWKKQAMVGVAGVAGLGIVGGLIAHQVGEHREEKREEERRQQQQQQQSGMNAAMGMFNMFMGGGR
ncbi:hypothetical protein KIPB_005118 [Kipferlia bialata]|nr:hypothetical protein KIPB_005118 [Kipferlia bialata]|eukprot:g5118.t1